jgi:hypothetical protein
MNPALCCIEDTLRLLLEEAKQAQDTAAANRGSPGEAFEVGRAEALAEGLHTWANQLQTFGLDAQLNGIWEELTAFLASRGFSASEALPNQKLHLIGAADELFRALDEEEAGHAEDEG